MSICKKDLFLLPPDTIYLDGNSLGPLTKASQARLQTVIHDQWGNDLIKSWNKHDWFVLAEQVGDKIAQLINAPKDSVTVCDSTSINIYKAIKSALSFKVNKRVSRNKILTDLTNFPTNLYIAQGIIHNQETNYTLQVMPTTHDDTKSPTQKVIDHLDEQIAILLLTHIGYNSGYAYDMQAITKAAQKKGITTIWDLSHSTGAVDIDVSQIGMDYAIGCTYKYLNGGPGSPAYLYEHPKHKDIYPAISGWMGQAEPFQFDLTYMPHHSIRKHRVGTPPILNLSSLDAALTIFEDIDLSALYRRGQDLLDYFILSIEERCPEFKIITPLSRNDRGSQLVIEPHDESISAYAIIQNLIERGTIGDFRQRNKCRFGIAPLYIDQSDIDQTIKQLVEIMRTRSWDNPKYLEQSLVT